MLPDHVGDVNRRLVRIVSRPGIAVIAVVAVTTSQVGITIRVDTGELQSARVQLLDLIDERGRESQRSQIPAILVWAVSG